MAQRKAARDEFEIRFLVDEATWKMLSLLAHRSDRNVNGYARSLVRRGVWGESRLIDPPDAKESSGIFASERTGEFSR